MRISRKACAEALSMAAGLLLVGILLRRSYDAGIVAAAVVLFVIGAVFRPRRLIGWVPALAVSFVWIAFSGRMYAGYNVFRLSVFGITAFPVIAWPTGLAFAYLYLVPLVRARPWPLRWLCLGLVWSVGIVTAEWLGYNFLGVHLDAGNAYRGWPILNIFHCPWWMQVAYFANGIVFMGMAAWLERNDDRGAPAGRQGHPAGGSEAVAGSEST